MAKKKITPVTILEDSIIEIEDGWWVCGELCKLTTEKDKPKMMACAVGMVSLYGGTGVKDTVQIGYYKTGPRAGAPKFLTVNYATYPGDSPSKWHGAPIETLKFLILAAKKELESDDGYISYDLGIARDIYDRLKAGEDVSAFDARDLSDTVVFINDNRVAGSAGAKRWFKKALTLAKKAEAKAAK